MHICDSIRCKKVDMRTECELISIFQNNTELLNQTYEIKRLNFEI